MKMKNDNYSAFTLVEMLIVMGIMIILMAAGIAGGQYALQQADRTETDAALGDIEVGLIAYYTDNRVYPDENDWGDLIDNDNLGRYLDSFDAGNRSTFFYWVDGNQQNYLICAQYDPDVEDEGAACRGNFDAANDAAVLNEDDYQSNMAGDWDTHSNDNWDADNTWDPEAGEF